MTARSLLELRGGRPINEPAICGQTSSREDEEEYPGGRLGSFRFWKGAWSADLSNNGHRRSTLEGPARAAMTDITVSPSCLSPHVPSDRHWRAHFCACRTASRYAWHPQKVVPNAQERTLKSIVRPDAKAGSTVYTDEAPRYEGMPVRAGGISRRTRPFEAEQAGRSVRSECRTGPVKPNQGRLISPMRS